MNRLRKILIVFLAACTSVCISIAVAACTNKNGNYPDYKNPTSSVIDPPPGGENGEFNGSYVVKVQSIGGLALNGVQVSFKKNGTTEVSGISANGEIAVNLTPDEYVLEVDPETLPAGYYAPADASFKTSADNGEAIVSLPSKVIEMTAPSDKRYQFGEVMYDFSYTASSGEKKLLSELVESHRAVMLNFWFASCGPCNQEFPAIQEAYEQFKDDLAIVALSNQDTATAIRNYQKRTGYTFDMGEDTAGITSRFSVTGFPTTIMIDRYGVIAYRSSGYEASTSAWLSLFAKFTSDDYMLPPINGGPNPPDGPSDFVPPDESVTAPDYEALMKTENGILGEGAFGAVENISVETGENDKDRSWPWLVESENGKYFLSASNKGTTPTFAIIYFDFTLKSGDILSFDYNYHTQASDYIYLILDSTTRLASLRGNSEGWKTAEAIYTASRDVKITLSFIYIKVDNAEDEKVENDFAQITNFTVQNVKDITYPIDFARSAADYGVTLDDIELGDDGFYHVRSADKNVDGAVLFTDLRGSTAWSIDHVGSSNFITSEEGQSRSASLYDLSFWEFSNYKKNDEGVPTTDRDGSYTYTKYSSYLNALVNMQNLSSNGYVPVTKILREIMEDFCKTFADSQFNVGKPETYDGEWLEMCYVYEHHNGDHPKGTECNKYVNSVAGLSVFNSFPAYEGENKSTPNHVDISYENAKFYYTFTATRSGAYKIYTDEKPVTFLPLLIILDSDGIDILGDRAYYTDASNMNGGDDFVAYSYLKAGETLYLRLSMTQPAMKGEYDFYIEYVGEEFDWIRAASSGGFVGVLDDEGNLTAGSVYDCAPWTLDSDGYYYTYTPDEKGEYDKYDSVIYIEFLHLNYAQIASFNPVYDGRELTLYELIESGAFNLNDFFRPDYTSKMRDYYNAAISRDEDDPLYGFVEASEELVNMLALMLEYRGLDGDGLESGFWTAFAYYIEHYGPESD